MFFGIHNKGAKHEIALQVAEENSPHVLPEWLAVKKLPSVGMPDIDFTGANELKEFIRQKPKNNTDCTHQRD
jgi:hypothetical protein